MFNAAFLNSNIRFRYMCPIKKNCSVNESKNPKPMGYKQYAIHVGHEHNMVEIAMREDTIHAKEVAPVLKALTAARKAEVKAGQMLKLFLLLYRVVFFN